MKRSGPWRQDSENAEVCFTHQYLREFWFWAREEVIVVKVEETQGAKGMCGADVEEEERGKRKGVEKRDEVAITNI
jgi:hypothetical protein